jgi:DNA replication and repair protein RecF
MRITRLTLDQFRVYHRLELELSAGGLRVSGRNASGKTSLIEAIALASTTRSPRSRNDREVVRWDSGIEYGVPPYARIEAETIDSERRHEVDISLEKADRPGETIFRKRYRLDGKDSRAHDVVGVIKTVLFSPEDVQLIAGPPAERRRHADILLSQIDRAYLAALAGYGRVLSQRNGLLRSFARERVDFRSPRASNELGFWDQRLVEHGAYIVMQRERYLTHLAELMGNRSADLIDRATLRIDYEASIVLPPEGSGADRLEQVRQCYLDALAERRSEEFRRGNTVVGPHRDDVRFMIDDRDLAAYGSRGQQRLAVIAYKLAESDVITTETGERPILLLDDVLSELDRLHRDMLLGAVAQSGSQVVVTSTDEELLGHPALADIPQANVEMGVLTFL